MSAAPNGNGDGNAAIANGANGPDSRGDTILSVEKLRAGYGDIPVLRGVSMELAENEVLGLLGHNGMGKSTLLKTLMGLLPATGGQISFEARRSRGCRPGGAAGSASATSPRAAASSPT